MRAVQWLGLVSLLSAISAARAQSPIQASPGDSTDSLRPGDAVHLRFFGDSAASGDFRVDERGDVTLPLLGMRNASRQPPDVLRKEIAAAYAKSYRYPPEVVLLRRITVLGAVTRPGLYLADPTMGLAELMALAGGPTPNGRPDEVRIIRQGQTLTAQTNGIGGLRLQSIRSGDQVYVPERSWLARNTGLLIGAIGSLTAVIALVAR